MPSTGRLALLVAVVALVTACAAPAQPRNKQPDTKTEGSSGTSGSSVDNGRRLFVSRNCGNCHMIQGVQGAVSAVGPNLSNIASVAGQRKSDMPPEEYLRESITEPDAYVVQGFRRGAMPKLSLDDQQVDDLVAFLMTRQ